jgi:cyclic-di-GMP phosphodiesterase TipF (flagellum assembly factor)
VRYYEAFSRIRNEDGDMILPEQYISVAAGAGLVSTIDNLLLLRCVQLVRAKRGPGELGFFCNISSFSLSDEAFFPQFIEFLQHNRRKLSEKIVFEFRESDLGDMEARDHLAQLAELGFALSLDQVAKLDADFAARNFCFVKIGAKTLLSAIEHNGMTVRAAELARELKSAGIDVVAEKVEHEKTLIDLLEYELGYAQEYLLGEPRPSEETI